MSTVSITLHRTRKELPPDTPSSKVGPFTGHGVRGGRTLRWTALSGVLAAALATTGCELVGGIFKAGFWVGIVAVVAIVGLLAFAARKLMT